MLDQETGLRGFVLSGEEELPRALRRRAAPTPRRRWSGMQTQLRFDSVAEFRPEIDAIADAARDWELNYADPTIAEVRANPPAARAASQQVQAGKARFDRFRASVDRLNARLGPARADGREALRENATVVWFWVIFTARRDPASASRSWRAGCGARSCCPLQALAGRVREVARGDYEREVDQRGRGRGASSWPRTSRRCARGSSPSSPRCRPPRPTCGAPTPSSSSSPTSPRTTSRSRCARSRRSASCSSSATAASSTRARTSTSASRSTARGACRT